MPASSRRRCEPKGWTTLIIGQGAALLLGFPGTTQDVDIFLPKSRENSERMIRALRRLDFPLEWVHLMTILTGSDVVILRDGPFALDLFYSLDGVENFEAAKARSVSSPSRSQVLSIEDVIATKVAASRPKDRIALPLLEIFRRAYHEHHGDSPNKTSEL